MSLQKTEKLTLVKEQAEYAFRYKAEQLKEQAEYTFRYKAEQLKKHAASVKESMEKLIGECDNALNGQPYSINDLGVLQFTGLTLDRLCGELATVRDFLRLL